MATLEVVRIRVEEREDRLDALRHKKRMLEPSIKFAGPREQIMLRTALATLERQILKAERALERSYKELQRAPRPQIAKAAPLPVSSETASDLSAVAASQ